MTPTLTATYRVQLNSSFTFVQAREIVPYLHKLGISHLYCSPILTARRGSRHGYDIVDPTRLNPELGTEADLRALATALHERGMGLIVDIVPNHMGIGVENPFWDDVLAHGERSRYARWFDIDWAGSTEGVRGEKRHLVLPILGDELEQVIERGELTLRADETGQVRLSYFEHSFPLDPNTLPPQLQLIKLDPGVRTEAVADFSASTEPGRDRLRALVESQHYQLRGWRAHASEINYRHFFDVPDLAALRMEDPAVFDETHALILRLVREGMIDGLRVDHVDGLRDPEAYLRRLRVIGDGGWAVGERGTGITAHRPSPTANPPLFIEKILAYGEELRESWLVDGTTGYDFLNDVEDLFLAPDGAQTIERDYRRIRRLGQTTFRDVARAAKRAALAGPLRGDLDRVAALAEPLAAAEKRPVDRKQLATAIAELIASISVYRTYLDGRNEPPEADRAVLERAVADVRRRAPQFGEIAQFVVSLMLDRGAAGGVDRRLEFTFRFQQLRAPAAAKGVEDTALYLYVPLVSRNEVGGGPDRDLTCAIAHFHEANTRRAEHWPLGLTATTTHDTKRSADVRSRLDALSEVPHDWERTVHRWRRLNTRHRVTVRGRLAPDTNTEYLLYQTLVALWPAPRAGRRSDDLPDRTWRDSARERLEEYIVKAAREAKTRTSWTSPDAGYEAALRSFVRAILTPGEDAPFLADVARIVARIAAAGAWNALSRMVLHMSSPGTPDTYQGDEIWNFVLVDPDNRRTVDYKSRQAALDALPSIGSTREKPQALDPFDSRTKLLVLHRLLCARRERADLFSRGNYRPLDVVGPRASHVVAFVRSHQNQHAICIGGRILCELDVNQKAAVWWQDTEVLLPPDIGGGEDLPWRSAIDGTEVRVSGALPLGLTLTHFPGALIVTA